MHLTYLALDPQGRETRGTLEASSPSEAASTLRAQGLFPVEVTPGAPAAALPDQPRTRRARLPRPVTTGDLVLWCSQLALMLRTGLTLTQALDTLARRAERPALRKAAERLAARVQGGDTLSRAIADEPKLPAILSHLVHTAEATGELDRAFDQAAEYLERRAALKAQLTTSLLYPGIVVLLSVAMFWFLTASVIPKLARFLTRRRVSLPASTQFLLDLSAFLHAWGPLLLAVAATLTAAALAAYRTPRGRLAGDRLTLKIPLIGHALQIAAMSHLARTLGLLLRSGLPLLEALRILRSSFSNAAYAAACERAIDDVIRGRELSKSLEGTEVTELTLQVLSVGEQTGALEHVLDELASFYDTRLQRLIRLLSGFLEPAVLLVVGGMVGFVYFSFFQAIFQLASS